MTDLELRNVETFTAVVDEGSFARAASRLGYTQSTVSQHIASLERAMDGLVFDRPGGPRRVQLTPLGRVVLEHARTLLEQTESLHTAVERHRAGEGRLTIGTFQSVSNTIVPALIDRLRGEFPTCDLRLTEAESDTPDLSKVDFAFYDHDLADPEVEHLKLLDDPYRLVAVRGCFPVGSVALRDLDGAPMVAWPPDCAQPSVYQALAQRDIRPQVVFSAMSNQTVISMVRVGLGSAILPSLAVQAAGIETDQQLTIHRLEPEVAPREVLLIRRAQRTRSPLAERAARLAIRVARDFELAAT
ncbi:MAG: LysR family transcriptional regulator [Nocardioides sp.]